MNLADAMARARVLEPTLQQQLQPLMSSMRPRPSIYYPDFIAANQSDRADNVLVRHYCVFVSFSVAVAPQPLPDCVVCVVLGGDDHVPSHAQTRNAASARLQTRPSRAHSRRYP
jgi:hypothetical protein